MDTNRWITSIGNRHLIFIDKYRSIVGVTIHYTWVQGLGWCLSNMRGRRQLQTIKDWPTVVTDIEQTLPHLHHKTSCNLIRWVVSLLPRQRSSSHRVSKTSKVTLTRASSCLISCARSSNHPRISYLTLLKAGFMFSSVRTSILQTRTTMAHWAFFRRRRMQMMSRSITQHHSCKSLLTFNL